ncbi:motility associated factor glycosyltransferase family protein [Thermoanaerobacterium sp. DL9XJH110]|uniref:motility associated factor glycosyltransferase family protein n=1 Tax=Thermoanaerobacterium sp. DL9XJH110 TaxID=3386643 RepID=UPI003BB641E8
MDSFYELNLKVLKDKDSFLYSKVIEFEKKNKTKEIFAEDSKNGSRTMYCTKDGKRFYLHSAYDPLTEGERWSNRVVFKKDDIIIILGVGMGYHIREVIDKIKNEEENLKEKLNIRVILLEPSIESFVTALKNADMTDLLNDENILILVEEEPDSVIEKISMVYNPYTPEKVNLYEYSPFAKVFNAYVERVREKFFDFLSNAVVNLNTTLFFSRLWTENLFKNIPHIISSPGVSSFFGMFDNIPAIIVSAGPSLDKNVELLKDVKGRALIICVGTALKALLKRNIEPDVVISIDGAEANFKHFQGIENDLSKVPLIYEFMLNYKILNAFKGPKIVFSCGHFMSEWIVDRLRREVGVLKVGGSVACLAFDLARRAGANPVIFIGQDLAFTDGKTHAAGTVYEKNRVEATPKTASLIKVKDIYGNEIYTNYSMYTFLKWFEREIKDSDKSIEFIDATEGGAKIEGTTIMTLREAIDKYCRREYPIQEKIFSAINSFNKPSREVMETFINSLVDLSEQVNSLVKDAKKGRKFSRELFEIYDNGSIHSDKIKKILRKLDRIDDGIKNSKAKEAIAMAVQPVIKLIYAGSNDFESQKDEKMFGKLVSRKSELLYNGICEQGEFVLKLIDECIENLKNLREGQTGYAI